MKFNLNALAAAALLATAGSSFAAINNSANTAGADVVFAAYDFGAGLGFVLDTNIKFSSSTGIGNAGQFSFTYDLDNSTAWGSFLAASAANGASTGVQWTTFTSSTINPGSAVLLGNNAALTTPNISSGSLGSIRGNFNSVIAAVGVTTNADAGYFLNAPTLGGIFGAAGTQAGRTSFDTTELFVAGTPSSQNLFRYAYPAGTGSLVGSSSIDSGNVLNVLSPVPEPGTYALMFAGLMTLGAVARRRSR